MLGSIIHALVIDINERQLNTVAQLRVFLNGTLEHPVGYSRQHLTRRVRRALRGEILAKRYTSPTSGFARTFLAADVALLRPPWMAEGRATQEQLPSPDRRVARHVVGTGDEVPHAARRDAFQGRPL